MESEIRLANVEDVDQIAQVHVQSWQETYTGLINQNFLNNFTVESRKKSWNHLMFVDDGPIFVAVVDNKIVGFVRVKKNNSDTGELQSLYLLKEYQGQGIGKQLFNTGVDFLKKNGVKVVIIYVLDTNKSKHYYEKMGAEYVSSIEQDIEGQKAEVDVYQLEIN